MKEERQDNGGALANVLANIRKQFGEMAILRLGDAAQSGLETISTGAIGLDLALGVGGLPKGRIVELYGHESSGKTTLALHVIANAQRAGGVAAFIDAEHALDPAYARKIGVDLDALIVAQPNSGEEALTICEELVKSGALDVVVVDSVAALTPQAEIDGNMGDSHVGLQARLMSQAMRKLNAAIAQTKTLSIFTNQVREKIGVLFGNPETTPGGKALKFYASCRLQVQRIGAIKTAGGEIVGNRTRVKVVKNKVAAPFTEAEFDILYACGISWEGSVLDAALARGVAEKRGSWLAFDGENLAQGTLAAIDYLRDHPETAEKMAQRVRTAPEPAKGGKAGKRAGRRGFQKGAKMSIPTKCKVSVLKEPKKMELVEVDLPALGDDEILVKVEGCGICGTDVHEYKGDPFGICPVQLGHEGTGEVVALGKNVTKDFTGKPLKVGDKIVTGLKSCGTCDTCLFHPEIMELCNNGEIFGLLPGEKHYLNGWFGEYMKVNAGGVVFNVSDMDRDLRILIEPAAVIVHAVEQAKQIFNFKFDSYVLVQGCGPIGLLLLNMVRCLGVRNIIACDTDANRLAFAKKLGARYVVNGLDADATEQVKKLTGGEGAEMVFQCTGSPKAATKAWSYVRRGGSFCELGFFVNNGDTTYNPHIDMCNKQVKAIGSWTYQAKDWVQSFDFLKESQERGFPITDLITHKYTLDQMNEAMEMNISMQGLKIAFVP